MLDLLAEGEQMLSSIPQCAKQSVSQAVADSGCGFDVKCLCTDTNFFAQLQEQLPHVCSLDKIDGSFSGVSKLCLEAVPSLSESRVSTLLGSIISLTTLATLAVMLRFAARKVSVTYFGMDDVLIVLALVSCSKFESAFREISSVLILRIKIFAYGNDIILLVAVRFGYGKHAIVLSAANLLNFAKCIWAEQILFACSVTFTKLSILVFYHRIFPSRMITKLSIFTGVFMILWLVAAILGVIFSCVPVTYFWDKSIKTGGRCINQYAFTHSLTAFNILTDFVVLVLPIPSMRRLQIKTARKFAILGIFLLGSFVCIAAMVRIFFINTIHWSDAPYTFVVLGVWLNIECNVGIVSACLPILPPLLNCMRKIYRSRLSSRGSSNAHARVFTAGSERNEDGGERERALERKDERVRSAHEESEVSSFELRTPKPSPLNGTSGYNESEKIDAYDEVLEKQRRG